MITDLLPRRSETQRWEFPAPWSLRSIELVPRSAGADLNAELAFFGQSAVETHERAVACLREGDLLVDEVTALRGRVGAARESVGD